MNVHKNARTTPRSRENIVGRVLAGESARAIADDVGVCESTVRKWVRRYCAEGRGGLRDRSCRPQRSPTATPTALVRWVERLRRQRWTGAQIAGRLQLSVLVARRSEAERGRRRRSARAYQGDLRPERATATDGDERFCGDVV